MSDESHPQLIVSPDEYEAWVADFYNDDNLIRRFVLEHSCYYGHSVESLSRETINRLLAGDMIVIGQGEYTTILSLAVE